MFNSSLSVFVCVADCGSFTKAAELLYISSPAVMKRINALEEHLQLKLMDRSRQGIQLTPAGEIIYKNAKIMIEQSEQAITAARQAASTAAATFRVGTSLLNPCKPFMDLWYHLSSQFPEYHIRIIPLGDEESGIFAELPQLGKKFDFFIGAYSNELSFQFCNHVYLGEYHICCAVRRDHPLAQKRALQISDLYGEILMIGGPSHNARINALREELVRNHPKITIENTEPYYNLNVFNYCIDHNRVLLTLECWSEIHPALVTIPVAWDYTMPYGLVYPKEPDQKVLRLVKVLQESSLR